MARRGVSSICPPPLSPPHLRPRVEKGHGRSADRRKTQAAATDEEDAEKRLPAFLHPAIHAHRRSIYSLPLLHLHQPTMTTTVNHSPAIPAPISIFLKKFYTLSDTESAHEEYSTAFTSPTHFQIGPMKPVSTHEEILQWRKSGWEKIGKRRHVIQDVFVHPDAEAAGAGGEHQIMLHGFVEFGFRDGNQGKASWGGRMVLQGTDSQELKIKSYDVWIVSTFTRDTAGLSSAAESKQRTDQAHVTSLLSRRSRRRNKSRSRGDGIMWSHLGTIWCLATRSIV